MAFLHPFEVDGAHRAAVLGERLSRCAALRGNEIADRLAAEIRLAGAFGERRIDARSLPFGVDLLAVGKKLI